VLVLGIFVFTFTTLYANEINVTIDGAAIDFEGQGPTIVDGRTLVPIREVFEHLGFDVVWYEGGMVTLTREDYEILVFSDNPIYLVNEDILWFRDVPPQNIGGRTMLPIRELLEAVGYFVSWDHGTSTVVVSSTSNVHTVLIGTSRLSTATTSISHDNRGHQDEDIVSLRYLVDLASLTMGNNQISDLTPIAGLTGLTNIDLRQNQIEDLSPLAGLVNLRDIWLFDNQISDISVLAELPNLTFINLSYNQISDISALAGFTSFQRLHLNSNQISDISPLAGVRFTGAGWLSLQNNQISDISPLAGVTGITSLDLSGNPIQDWSPVAHIERVTGRPWNWEQLID